MYLKRYKWEFWQLRNTEVQNGSKQ